MLQIVGYCKQWNVYKVFQTIQNNKAWSILQFLWYCKHYKYFPGIANNTNGKSWQFSQIVRYCKTIQMIRPGKCWKFLGIANNEIVFHVLLTIQMIRHGNFCKLQNIAIITNIFSCSASNTNDNAWYFLQILRYCK